MAATKPAQKPASAASNSRSALVWGGLAFCSILAVCALIAFRIGAAGGSIVTARVSTTPPPAQPVIQKPQGASEFEVARLNDAIRALATERDRLSARVETLEQSVGDITASITKKPAKEAAENSEKPKQEAAIPNAPETRAPMQSVPPDRPVTFQTPPPPPNPYPTPAQRSMPYLSVTLSPPKADKIAEKPADRAEPSETEEDRAPAYVAPIAKAERQSRVARTAVTQPTPPPVRRPPRQIRAAAVPPTPPPAPEITASKGPPTQVAQILPQQPQSPPEITGATRTEFGVDLGGETSLDGLRARWANIKGRHGEALEGLRPLVRVREGSRPGTVELHLVVGPVANAGTAARVCAKLQSTGIACQASEYDGQRLTIR
jgi:hypothetical protein